MICVIDFFCNNKKTAVTFIRDVVIAISEIVTFYTLQINNYEIKHNAQV